VRCEDVRVSQQFEAVIRDDTVKSYSLRTAMELGKVEGSGTDGKEWLQVLGVSVGIVKRMGKGAERFEEESGLAVEIAHAYMSISESLLKIYHTNYLYSTITALYTVDWAAPFIRRYRNEEAGSGERVDLTVLLLAVEGELQGRNLFIRRVARRAEQQH
jgi:hypothetical protein